MKLDRRVRRYLNSLFNESIFDKKNIQDLLGFTKDGTTIIEKINQIQIEYSYNSTIGNQLFYRGDFEDKEINFFIDKLSEQNEPIILDIGANIGWHSLRWAKALENAKIFAFEPAPNTQVILQRNIARNCLDNKVFIVPQAVSDQLGYANFFYCEDDAFSSLKDTQRKKIVTKIQVPVTTIDEFVKSYKINNISLIKVDVEGFETEVINGAINTIKQLKPELFIEIYGGTNSNLNPDETIRLICSLGYQAFVLVNGVAVPFKQHSDSFYNYYFTCNRT